VIRSFKSKDTEAVFGGQFVKGLDGRIQQRAREKLKYLDSAAELRDLRYHPGINSSPLRAIAKGNTAFGSTSNGGFASSGMTATHSR
jgi:plasmid maintenance system killer protein